MTAKSEELTLEEPSGEYLGSFKLDIPRLIEFTVVVSLLSADEFETPTAATPRPGKPGATGQHRLS
jgi:hypothetical protein